ncbi:oxidoreductase [Sorangium cellulosum]|uniref:Oxidoreductase n=1 Tax=Sorangium cellulosum TaxID=56 RepID=A0A2L0F1H1_SORCE|nr:NAD(P)H-binding protein [Sorangium cellulosum]AUX45422.1 oxidoreductase [Sorangium cellulosum]
MSARAGGGRPRILVVGGTGTTGRAIAARIEAAGARVRLASRTAPAPREGVEHARFDWADPATHEEALRGIDRAYLLAPAMVEDPAPLMMPFIERALAGGARRFVLLSASAVPEGSPGLGAVHRALRERAPEWTVLQPSWFMQNFINPRHHHGAGIIAGPGELATATGGGRVGFVDADDVAEVAARALLDEAPHNTSHVITGPEALSYDDVAAILTEVVGRPIRHVHVGEGEARARLVKAGVPAPYAAFLVRLDLAIRDGAEDRTTDTVQRVTGRAPRAFRDLARAHAHAFR